MWELRNSLTPPGTFPRQRTLSIHVNSIFTMAPPCMFAPWIASLQKSTWYIVDTHTYLLIEWMNEWNEKNNNWKYFCSCRFLTKLPLPYREPFENEDSILPVLHIQSNHRQLAIFGYLWDTLNVPLQPKLISISYGWTVGSSCVVTHTAHIPWEGGAETLPHSPYCIYRESHRHCVWDPLPPARLRLRYLCEGACGTFFPPSSLIGPFYFSETFKGTQVSPE